jgi:DeoR/GlpR family transcriptional regulator of sugar metabolism
MLPLTSIDTLITDKGFRDEDGRRLQEHAIAVITV